MRKEIPSTWFYRLLAIKLLIIGLSLYFMPMLLDLKFLPLVTVLVKSKVSFLACPIFAAVVATTIALLVFSVSWFLCRPYKALCQLVLAGVGCYFIFFTTATVATS